MACIPCKIAMDSSSTISKFLERLTDAGSLQPLATRRSNTPEGVVMTEQLENCLSAAKGQLVLTQSSQLRASIIESLKQNARRAVTSQAAGSLPVQLSWAPQT